MLTQITTLGTYGGPSSAPPVGPSPVLGPVVTLAFVLPIAGPVPNVIVPPVPQSCQNSSPNVSLEVLVVDQDGNPVDLSTAASLELWLLSPTGIPRTVPAVVVSNGLDGKLFYTVSAQDLPEAGLWSVQAQMTFGVQVIVTRWGTFWASKNAADFNGGV